MEREDRIASLVLEHRVNDTESSEERIRVNSVFGLYKLLNYVGDIETMVEVGSHWGVSTELFALRCCKVVAVDIWSDHSAYVKFLKRMMPYEHVSHLRMTSLQAVELIQDESLDLVYIDANHFYNSVRADILAWTPKVKKGGWIAGHDYTTAVDGGDVCKAVNEIFVVPHAVFEDSSWLVKKD